MTQGALGAARLAAPTSSWPAPPCPRFATIDRATEATLVACSNSTRPSTHAVWPSRLLSAWLAGCGAVGFQSFTVRSLLADASSVPVG